MNTDVNAKLQDILNRAGDTNAERVSIDGAYVITEDGNVVPAEGQNGFVLCGENGSLPKALAEELNLPIRKDAPKPEPSATSGVTFNQEPPVIASESTDTQGNAPEAVNDLPQDFPGRNALLSAGITSVAEVQGKGAEDLTAVPGIGAATADKILSYGK